MGWLVAIVAIGLPVAFVMSSKRHHNLIDWSNWADSFSSNRSISLDSSDKAEAFYALLSPDDVQVVVSRNRNTISFSGSSVEMTAVERLGRLLDQDSHGRKSGRGFDGGNFIEQTYSLSPKMIRRLSNVFSFSDVPVFAAKEGGTRIRISASQEDMNSIHEFISNVLHGELESGTINRTHEFKRSR